MKQISFLNKLTLRVVFSKNIIIFIPGIQLQFLNSHHDLFQDKFSFTYSTATSDIQYRILMCIDCVVYDF